MLFLFFTACLILATLPGWLAYHAVFHSNQDTADEQLGYSLALSFCILSLVQFSSFLLKTNPSTSNGIILSVISIIFLGVITAKKRWPSLKPPRIFYFFALFCGYATLLLTILPTNFLAFSADWRLYHPNTAYYLNEAPLQLNQHGFVLEYLLQRTPFFSLLNTFMISFFENHYYMYQISSSVVNASIFFGIFLLTKRFFSSKAAYGCLMLLPLMPIIICRIGVPTPKPIVVFFILLAWYLYLKIRENASPINHKHQILLAITITTGYMIHPLSLFYFIWMAVDQIMLWIKRKVQPNWILLFYTVGAAIIIIFPWYMWSTQTFGFDKVFSPTYTISDNTMQMGSYLLSRITMLLTTLFFPVTEPLVQIIQGKLTTEASTYFWMMAGNTLYRGYIETFLLGFTLIGFLSFIYGWITQKVSPKNDYALFFIYMLLGALSCLGVHFLVDLKSHAFNIMGPLVCAVFIFLAANWDALPKRTKIITFALIAAEFIFIRYMMYWLTLNHLKMLIRLKQRPLAYLYEQVHRIEPNATVYLSIVIFVIFVCYMVSIIKFKKS